MTIKIQDEGGTIDVEVRVDVEGFITLAVWRDMKRMSYDMPPMTPFEAGMLGRELQRAAEKAERK